MVSTNWRDLSSKDMRQLRSLYYQQEIGGEETVLGTSVLQSLSRTFSPNLVKIELEGVVFERGMGLWLFVEQATDSCPNLETIDLNHCTGTGLPQVLALALKAHYGQSRDGNWSNTTLYETLCALGPNASNDKSPFCWETSVLREDTLHPRILVQDDYVPPLEVLSTAVVMNESHTAAMLLAFEFHNDDESRSFLVSNEQLFATVSEGNVGFSELLL